jgi:RNA polymerase sigma-70 factor (ECF subfamily)
MSPTTALSEITRPEPAPRARERDWQPLASLRLVADDAVDEGLRAVLATTPPQRPQTRLPLDRSDESLAGRVSRDGQAPFAVLYERHRADLHRYCVSVVRDHEEAADAAQEAWLRAFVALRSPQMRPISFRAWLYAIARNACTDRLRDRGRCSLNELSEHDLGRAESSADLHEAREDVRVLLADLAALSERQRSAIALREIAGLSIDEIAATLATTPPKATSLIAEARRVLQERHAGRLLSCDAVRARIEMLRVHSHGVRAHIDDCGICRSHHATTRGRLLSSFGVAPLGLLRPLLARLGLFFRHTTGFDSFASKVAAAGALALVAGTGLAVQGSGGHGSATHPRARPHVAGPASSARRGDADRRAGSRHASRVATPAPQPAATRAAPAAPTAPAAPGGASTPTQNGGPSTGGGGSAPAPPSTPVVTTVQGAARQLATGVGQGPASGGKSIAGAPAIARALGAAVASTVTGGAPVTRAVGSSQRHL